MIVNKSFYPLPQSFTTTTAMQRNMESLQLQLGSGKRYNTLAEFGTDRLHDLSLRARLGRMEGYSAAITTTENRLSFASRAIERMDKIEADTRALATPSAYGSDGVNMVNASKQAEVMLREVIDLLNTDMAGEYIFGGHVSDKKPVSLYEQIMKGAPGLDGFEKIAQERRFVDKGLAGLGRLTIADSGTGAVSLSEDGTHPFGFKLATATGGEGFATVSGPTGSPASVGIDFTGPDAPRPGDTITIGVSFPDDRNRIAYITLTATDADTPGPGQFKIGADAAENGVALAAALNGALSDLAGSKLASASTMAAADDFFTSDGAPARRVVFPDPGNPWSADPVAQADDAFTRTVRWYNGQTGTDPRGMVTARIDETTQVRVGATADESGFALLVKSLAAMASSDFTSTPTDTEAQKAEKRARFDAMGSMVRERLSEDRNTTKGSIESVALELGLASNTLGSVKTRHAAYGAQLKTLLADIEVAPLEEVAMQMMTLQTRLQASFQATAMISQLSLVNYLR